MSRIQVPDLPSPSPIQPSAEPVQRFVLPPRPLEGPNQAQQLAQSLSALQPSLQQFLTTKDDRFVQQEEDKARATRLQLALTFQDAVKQGKISPDQSPFFVRAYQESDGRVAADQYNQDLLTALATGPFAESTDPNETAGLFKQFRQNWMKQNGIFNQSGGLNQSPAFLDGFVKNANTFEAEARDHQARAVGQRIVDRAYENAGTEIQGVLQEAHTKDLTPHALGEGINTILNRGIFVGMNPKQVNELALKAVAAEALQTANPAVFGVLNHVKSGAGVLGKTSAAIQLRDETTSKIAGMLHEYDTWARQKDQQDREDAARLASSSIVKTIETNRAQGKATTFQDVAKPMQTIATTNPALYESLDTMLKTSKTDALSDKENEDTKNLLYESLYSTGTVDRTMVIGAAQRGLISNSTMTDLLDREDRQQNDRITRQRAATEFNQGQIKFNQDQTRFTQEQQDRSLNMLTRNPVVSQMLSNIDRAFSQEGTTSFDNAKAIRQMGARTEFMKEIDDWLHANPNASFQDQMKKANSLATDMIDLFGARITDAPDIGVSPAEIINGTRAVRTGRAPAALPPQQPQPTPSQVIGNPQTTAVDRGKAQRLFGSTQEWQAALQEFNNAPKETIANTKLGRILSQQGVTAADLTQWLTGQNSLYDSSNK